MSELLNQEQLDAVKTIDGPLLVLAGAGSGKTRVVTYRITYLIENGVPAESILGLTFTNKAATEMQERVKSITQSYVLISTFHSLGARILRESITSLGYTQNFTIYDEEDTKKVLLSCLRDLNLKETKEEIKALRSAISNAKNNLQLPDEIDNKKDTHPYLFDAYSLYQKQLKANNAVDFDDLLLLPVRLLREHPEILEKYQNRWRYLLIDEYQDTNKAQYTFVNLLVAKSQNLCVVGDPDQSIYSWRGANIYNILKFEQDYPSAKVIRLEQNYRSRSNILNAANNLISCNTERIEKNLWSNRGDGEKIKHYTAETERQEATFIARKIRYYHEVRKVSLRDMVVFYRTNAQSRAFEDSFLIHRIPYVIVGGISFYQRKEIKDILAYLRMVQSGSDYISFSRCINLPKRGIGETTLEKIRLGASSQSLSILPYCRSLLRGEAADVKLTAKQKTGLTEFVQTIDLLKQINLAGDLANLVKQTIEKSGYLDVLEEDKETMRERKANLDSLITKALEWEETMENPSLTLFLEELALKSSLDEADISRDRVSLMTLHNGKGLEFNLVFLVGLEEGLIPHQNSLEGEYDKDIEEERRLCYVGITRAKEWLYLTHTRIRYLWGVERLQKPSRFFNDIPYTYVEKVRE